MFGLHVLRSYGYKMKTCLNIPVLSILFIMFLFKGSKGAGDSESGKHSLFYLSYTRLRFLQIKTLLFQFYF